MKKYRQYTKEQFIEAVKTSKSYSEVCRIIGIKPVGGNLNTIRRKIQELGLDCSHFTGQLWSKDKQLKDWQGYSSSASIKRQLEKQRGHTCESCGLSEWLLKPIVLEMDHIDGDRANNDIGNLRLLCPNCHSQTPTWRNRKR